MISGGSTDGVDRRSFLAAGASGLAVATSGCAEDVRRILNADGAPLSLSITTLISDNDRASIRLARALENRFEAVGINTSLDARSWTDFRERVYVDQEFDLLVGPHPGGRDPDFLYESLHSLYANEVGWQNPYGFTNVIFDELLEAQRGAPPEERTDAVARLIDAFVEEKPFIPICAPTEFRLARNDRFDGIGEHDLATRHGYLGLDAVDDATNLTSIVTDSRPTINQNPFAVEYRMHGPVTDLLYDSLASVVGEEYVPWLAESWTWLDGAEDGDTGTRGVDGDPAPGPRAEVRLRPDCLFHDGERVTAEDVAFTYEFLTDTSLGRAEAPASPTYYRSLGDAVDAVEVRDERTVEFTFAANQDVAKQALTVPVLPEHVWREIVESADESELPTRQERWYPLSSSEVPLTGSGPYQFDSSTERDQLTLTRFDEHFTTRENVDLDGPTAEQVQFLVDPSSASAIQFVEQGEADLTTSPLEPHVYGNASEAAGAELIETDSQRFYHVGFNVRDSPLSNPYVRRTIGRLLDREAIVEEVFHGHADPVAVPVDEEWVPEDLRWDGDDPTAPFLGADGTLDVEEAKAAFEEIGFRYDANDEWVVSY